MFGSTSLRLAAIYIGGFAVAVALLGFATILSTRAALTEQFDTRIRAELTGLLEDYDHEGVPGVIDEIGEHKGAPGELLFGLEASGRPVAGRLAGLHPARGWSLAKDALGAGSRTRMMAVDLPGGYRLAVGDDWGRIATLDGKVARGFGLAFAALLAIGIAGGFALSRAVQKRLGAISGTAQAIIDGDLTRRIPVKGGDDLARLSRTINQMLDRIVTLMDSLRQVSSDVAHDLRTPLTRLRQRLELSARRAQDPAHRIEIEGALRDVDSLLATFAALLRIAEVEAGARRSKFAPLDLCALVGTVVEDFAPAAEDAGQSLAYRDHDGGAWIEGDADLITQMTVNLVENALRHTPRGSHVRVSVARLGAGVLLKVADDGPGVPAAERERLFGRFYRLERSRSTPGSGLGLSLVAAVARLHRADVGLTDAEPGLEVNVLFPTSPGSPT
jgi:signal transduction histidine kinase